MESLGKRISNIRKELNLNQKELAEKCGITEATLSRYENDLREPKSEAIVKIANALNVTTDYLLGRTDERHSKRERFQGVTTISAHRIGNIEQLPDEALDQLDDYIEMLKLKYKK